MQRLRRPLQWAALAIIGAVLAIAPGASAQAPTTASVVDKCVGVAHNRSQDFRDINGQSLTSPSVIIVGLLLSAIAPNTSVGVSFSIPSRPTVTGSARVGTDGRVLIAVPINAFGTYTPSLLQIGTTQLDPGPLGAPFVVTAAEVACSTSSLVAPTPTTAAPTTSLAPPTTAAASTTAGTPTTAPPVATAPALSTSDGSDGGFPWAPVGGGVLVVGLTLGGLGVVRKRKNGASDAANGGIGRHLPVAAGAHAVIRMTTTRPTPIDQSASPTEPQFRVRGERRLTSPPRDGADDQPAVLLRKTLDSTDSQWKGMEQ